MPMHLVYTDVEKCIPGREPGTCESDLNYEPVDGCTKVSWMSVVGEEYLVLLSEPDNYVFGGSVLLEVWKNDLCENAYNSVFPPWPRQSYFGSLDKANVDTSVPACGEASIPQETGVLYKVEGNGEAIIADTCTGTFINTQISVFRGDCARLECVVGNDDACGESGKQSAVTWSSEAGESYYILVHGNNTSAGQFSLNIETLLDSNEICENAEPLLVDPAGVELIVTVPLASPTVDPGLPDCGFYYLLSPDPFRGVWYSLVGTGLPYTIAIYSGTNAYLQVFDNTCEDLKCNGFPAGYEESITWETELDKPYLVYVFYPENGNAGDAEMGVSITSR